MMTMGRLVVTHRRTIALASVLLGAPLLVAASRVTERLEVSARLPHSESGEVEAVLASRFSSPFARSAVLVARGAPSPDTPAGRAVLQEVVTALRGATDVTRTYSYLDGADPFFLSDDPQLADGTFVLVGLDPGERRPDAAILRLREVTERLSGALREAHPGLTLRWTGQGPLNLDLRRASAEDSRSAERRALPVTLTLLVFAFGAVVAALLPVTMGALAIALALGAAALLAKVGTLSITLQSVVSMLGLGLGIDYSLLTVSRFRESLAAGRTTEQAAIDAADRAGRTVLLSAAAVAIGFLALLLVPLTDLRSVAVGGLIIVLVSALLAVVLLPGILAALGSRTDWGRLRRRRTWRGDGWRLWAHAVAAHPFRILVIAGLPMAILASEARRLQPGLPHGDWLPPEMESARGIHDLEAMGRGGVVQAVQVVLELPEDTSILSREGWSAMRQLAASLERDPRVGRVRSLASLAGERGDDLAYISLFPAVAKRTFLSQEGDAALLSVIPREKIDPNVLVRYVRELRSSDARALSGLAGTRLRVGGLPALNADYEDAVAGWLPKLVGLVLAATFLALLAAFRSVLVALKAIALNLLSVSAALGSMVLVFQDGLRGGAVFPAVPVLVFCTVFGLSMDYEVFLVDRVAEARRAGHGEVEALAEGLATTGSVITSAATIMVAVFAAFMLGGFLLMKMMGFALAIAVLLDATLVRVAIGPALLCVAGKWNWWPGLDAERASAPLPLQPPEMS
jgi:RND superfamily putative drug exporter